MRKKYLALLVRLSSIVEYYSGALLRKSRRVAILHSTSSEYPAVFQKSTTTKKYSSLHTDEGAYYPLKLRSCRSIGWATLEWGGEVVGSYWDPLDQ